MIVSATLPAAADAPASPLASTFLAGVLAAQTAAIQLDRRADRRARIARFLADPSLIDTIIPGASALTCGAANDRLRALRYDERRLGQTQLNVDSGDLYAALVSQRIRCWRALHGR